MKNKIKNIGWSIGNYCNAKCNHCYSWKTRRKSSDILTEKEVDIIISKLINYGVETVNFGGNEPIYTNGPNVSESVLYKIIRKLHSSGIVCGITTNGFTAHYLYENHREEFLMVNDWDFSLDAPCKDGHDNNRNVDGLFDSVISAIQICKLHDVPCSIVIAGMKSNLTSESLDDFIGIARENGTEIRINFLKPIEEHHFDMMPSVRQVYNAINHFIEQTNFETLSESVIASQLGIPSNGCPCGIHSFRIRSKVDGKVPVTPCVYLPIDGGDILTTRIEDIVDSKEFNDFRNRHEQILSKCHDLECEIKDECRGGCSARAFLVNGDMNSVDPYCPLINEKELDTHCFSDNLIFSEKEDDRIRVHENYLCTWIGKPKVLTEV